MYTTMTYLLAQEHINDLRREARDAQPAAQLRRTRRLSLAPPRLRLRRPRPATA